VALQSSFGTVEVSFCEDGIGEVCASDVCTDEFCTFEVLTFEVVASEIFTGKVFGHDFTQGDSSYFFVAMLVVGMPMIKFY
jgi:hypothetical protein